MTSGTRLRPFLLPLFDATSHHSLLRLGLCGGLRASAPLLPGCRCCLLHVVRDSFAHVLKQARIASDELMAFSDARALTDAFRVPVKIHPGGVSGYVHLVACHCT